VIVTLLLAGIASIIAASQFSYIGQRFDYFFSPEIDQAGRGVGWQTKQALIAVGG
jgi:cell division protein FtsW (lipid II flippase)